MTQSNMSKLHTHYDNLKVARDAPPEVIRAAYKTLCHKFHPDRHAGSEKATHTFQLINTAYEVLSNPASRSHHDAWIAKQERTRLASRSASVTKAWDGRERRRRSVRGSTSSAADPLWHEVSERVSRPAIIMVLWASIGLVGAMLVVLHQL
jgi:DnaJ-class molecular chaperone